MTGENTVGKRSVQVAILTSNGSSLHQNKIYSADGSWVPILQDFLMLLSAEYGYRIQDSVRIKSAPWFNDEWYGEVYDDDDEANN
jgi:hypothetical protein